VGFREIFQSEKNVTQKKILKIPDLMALRYRQFEKVLTNNGKFLFSMEYYA